MERWVEFAGLEVRRTFSRGASLQSRRLQRWTEQRVSRRPRLPATARRKETGYNRLLLTIVTAFIVSYTVRCQGVLD